MTTLAERKSERDFLDGRLKAHLVDSGCVQCAIARKSERRCEEWQQLKSAHTQAVADIRGWFDAPPDSPTLFDG